MLVSGISRSAAIAPHVQAPNVSSSTSWNSLRRSVSDFNGHFLTSNCRCRGKSFLLSSHGKSFPQSMRTPRTNPSGCFFRVMLPVLNFCLKCSKTCQSRQTLFLTIYYIMRNLTNCETRMSYINKPQVSEGIGGIEFGKL